MPDTKSREKNSISATCFPISFTIRFSISMPIEKLKKLERYYGQEMQDSGMVRLKGLSKKYRSEFLHDLDCENSGEILKKYPKIKSKVDEISNELKKAVGVRPQRFAKDWALPKTDKFIEEKQKEWD